MAELTCEYGNCAETMKPRLGFKVTVTATYCGSTEERKSFCCYEHAALWCKRQHEHWQSSGAELLNERTHKLLKSAGATRKR